MHASVIPGSLSAPGQLSLATGAQRGTDGHFAGNMGLWLQRGEKNDKIALKQETSEQIACG